MVRSHALSLIYLLECIYVNILPTPYGAKKSILDLIGPVPNSEQPLILNDACFVVKLSL